MLNSNRYELRHLRYFLAVAEHLHFRQAANSLFISQPGLSRQIKALEEEIGVQLFERNNRSVQLTAAGHYFQKEVELLFKNLDQSLKHMRAIATGNEGNVGIAYVGSAMQDVIPNLLIQLRSLYPGIHFVLKEMDNMAQVQALLKNEIDLGFLRLNQVPKEIELHPVKKDTFSLVLPEDHCISEFNFRSIEQLKEESFILFEKEYSSAYYERVMSIFEEAGFSPIISHYTVHATTIFQLVENHFGISIIPSALTKGYNMKVKFIELKDISQHAILSMAWNRLNRNPVIRRIKDLMA